MRRAALLCALLLLVAPLDASRRCHSCSRDAHGRIQRSYSAKAEFRRTHPCPATGETRGACPHWVVDHVVPLQCGGADAPDNMQWETYAASREKDRNEGACVR